MNLDDLQFNNDEERRKYLSDLARLKKIREENKVIREGNFIFDEKPDDGIYSGEIEVKLPDIDSFDSFDDSQENNSFYENENNYYEIEEEAYERGYEAALKASGVHSRNEDQKKDRKHDRKEKDNSKRTKKSDKDKSIKHKRKADKHNKYYDIDMEDEEPRKKSKWWLWLLLAVLILLFGFIVYNMFFHKTQQEGFYTVAVFGVDSRDGNLDKGALSDVNIIARVDMATGEIKLVSCYRDTYVRIADDDTYHKFNEAYFRGGSERALWMIEDNLDIKVDDYATFNWKAVADTINILGGIDVEISDSEFAYINGFITETVNSTGIGSYQLNSAGMQHLDGIQAVAYARLRLMDTDYNRTERQRKVIALTMEKAKQADFATLNCILETVLPEIRTSVTLDDMIPFAKDIKKYYIGETCGWPYQKTGMDVGNRGDCVVPVTLETNVCALHQFLWPEIEYTPSDHVLHSSNHIAEITGQYSEGGTEIKIDNLDGRIGNNNPAVLQVDAPVETAPAETMPEQSAPAATLTVEETGEPVTGVDGGPGATEEITESETESTEETAAPSSEAEITEESASVPETEITQTVPGNIEVIEMSESE